MKNRLKNRDGFRFLLVVFAFSHVTKLFVCFSSIEVKKQNQAKQTPKIQTKEIETKKIPNCKLSIHLRISSSSSITKFMETVTFHENRDISIKHF